MLVKESAGTLLYRQGDNGIDVLLVHPSGNYNRHKPWSIPKGIPDPDETPMDAARRETIEETGVVAGELVDLGFIDYTKSKKRIYCFAGPAPVGAEPRCASWEVDQACFLPLERAREVLHPEQVAFLDRLVEKVRAGLAG
jgi:predicted NUDIX family NTP pyrophosphohydrolase